MENDQKVSQESQTSGIASSRLNLLPVAELGSGPFSASLPPAWTLDALDFSTLVLFSHGVEQLTDKEQLVVQLEKQYLGDVGVLAAFLFNYVKRNPGEALYLGANELHAYLRGECVECMATSDNVVRAGLTSKKLDVEILCSMLTYKQGFPEIMQGVPLNPFTKRYIPPFNEFEVDRCILPQGASADFAAIPGPSVFVVMEGEGTMNDASFEDVVREGDVLFAPANTDIRVTTASELQLYRGGVNSRFFEAS
ncbi:mannose-6-phosphate isomerase, type I [Actinidia rufa]|uniref:Mannose-6-phosphate isomerase, type I n=1 Tax=Actinidia rufa TaxID=165716 RepID=A0A7J0H753_9ERIC|nr:mannose-6-phosphate isomerase, type I [Actinidia rufa]